jgi:outer membrane murein-binding lipoprotein Lpp
LKLKENYVKSRKRIWTAAFLGMLSLAGCKGGGEELTSRLNEANDKVVACKKDVNDLKVQTAELKQKLAQAMANPSRVQLTDPDILNLIAEVKGKRRAGEKDAGSGPTGGDEVVLGKGDLNPKEASRVVKQGALSLQKCYERALKKNVELQVRSSLSVMLEITVSPTGIAKSMNLSPQVDDEMTECIRTSVARWRFPTFSGDPVVVAQKLTLTPKM